MPSPSQLATRLTEGAEAERLAVLETVLAQAETAERPWVDGGFAALRVASGFSALMAQPPAVRGPLLAAVRDLARLRGRRFGLRAPRPAELHRLGGAEATQAAVELVLEAVDLTEAPEAVAAALEAATPLQRALFAAWCAQAEICNGGFHQYFANSPSVVARLALEGFERLGAPTLAAGLRDALARFPADVDVADHEARAAALDALGFDAFRDLDARFFGAVEREFLPGAAALVRASPREFFEER